MPFPASPDRADVPHNAARPLRYIDRYLTVTQGEVFYVTRPWSSSKASSVVRPATRP